MLYSIQQLQAQFTLKSSLRCKTWNWMKHLSSRLGTKSDLLMSWQLSLSLESGINKSMDIAIVVTTEKARKWSIFLTQVEIIQCTLIIHPISAASIEKTPSLVYHFFIWNQYVGWILGVSSKKSQHQQKNLISSSIMFTIADLAWKILVRSCLQRKVIYLSQKNTNRISKRHSPALGH